MLARMATFAERNLPLFAAETHSQIQEQGGVNTHHVMNRDEAPSAKDAVPMRGPVSLLKILVYPITLAKAPIFESFTGHFSEFVLAPRSYLSSTPSRPPSV